jgi:diguanylate cyclase (GGDEF)-like protein
MTTARGATGARHWGVVLLSAALGTGALLLTDLVSAPHAWSRQVLPFGVPWWSLVPAYLAASLMPLFYETRNQARALDITQLAMAMGLVFVAPWAHLLARGCAGLLYVGPVRRQPPTKALYNLALSTAEVSVGTAVMALLVTSPRPSPPLWGALLLALLLAELVGVAAMQALFALLGVPQTLTDVRNALANCATTTGVFAGIGMLTVAAAWTDVWTIAVMAVISSALIVAYRKHRRLAAEQQQTSELHQFVKGLGPLDLDAPESSAVLDHARQLLNAACLDLSLQVGDGSWRQFMARDAQLAADDAPVPVDELEGAAAARRVVVCPDDRMSTPLLGAQDLVGVLTVRNRLGNVRSFGLRDVRLLETLAVELATAIERGRLQRDLALAATTDSLTRLPNLNEMTVRLERLVEQCPAGVIVTTMAVDSFREVNDTLGHQVGDDLLVEVTRRLRLTYPEALLGRIGGGRFAVAVAADIAGGDPAMFGLGLRAQIEGGAQLGPIGTHIKLSVGCVKGPDHGTDAATLIRRAETAMYSARHAHGGPVVWEPAYEVEGQRKLAVVMALREALSSGAIGVAFQPKVSAMTRTVTGVEALARWTHPALGAIPPTEFIPLAEAAGLMSPLTSTVLRQALTACKGWQRRGGRIGVAVNVSAETILDPRFVTDVAAILTSINIAPDLLTLELTEGVVVDDPALATERMSELRNLGVKISVDDFGTGYSSLTYLKGLPVDEVKVDKGFVDGIAHDEGDRAVVRAVVDIAHTLGLRVVAEGVEQEEQHVLLAGLGVDEIQGYLHGRPMAALDMAQWLRRREASTRQDTFSS